MKKTLCLKDWVLLGIGGLIDFVEEVRDPFHLIEHYYETYYGFVPQKFKKSNMRQYVWQTINNQYLEKKRTKGEVNYKITTVGLERIRKKFPQVLQKNTFWDRKWRLVIFDIEEKNKPIRNSLRDLLKHLGFAQMQRSVWISPFDYLEDFKRYILKKNLGNEVALVETKKIMVSNLKMFADRLWSIGEINNQQRELYEQLVMYKKYPNKLLQTNNKQQLQELKEKLLNLLLSNTYLPREFLPKDWYGQKLSLLVKELKIF